MDALLERGALKRLGELGGATRLVSPAPESA